MNIKKINQEELSQVLHNHDLWLQGKKGGKGANLKGAQLDEVSSNSSINTPFE